MPTKLPVVDVRDPKVCWSLPCYRAGEDKGSFTVGIGYTSYYKNPKWVCMTRHLHGCPTPIPSPDYEQFRCCYRPSFSGRGNNPVCRTCFKIEPRRVANALNTLPTLPGVPCKHARKFESLVQGWSECPSCRGGWRKPSYLVAQHEVLEVTFEEILAELCRRLGVPT